MSTISIVSKSNNTNANHNEEGRYRAARRQYDAFFDSLPPEEQRVQLTIIAAWVLHLAVEKHGDAAPDVLAQRLREMRNERAGAVSGDD
jgi:hypothetical protein